MQKVAILFGGMSTEHEVSLSSASNIVNALDRSLYEPVLLGVDKKGNICFNKKYSNEKVYLSTNNYFIGAKKIYLLNRNNLVEINDVEKNQVLNVFQIAFPIIHGSYGENGILQGILQSLQIPFVGSDVLGSAICFDKDVTKRLLKEANIPIADFICLYKHNANQYAFEDISNELGLPIFIKPANAGSSVGVSKVNNEEEYIKALNEAFKFDNKILVEEAIIGKEIECAVLGNINHLQASALGEIIPTENFYSYEAKYINPNGAILIIPANVSEKLVNEMQNIAIKAFQVTCCESFARVDFFLRSDNTFVVNEINTLPGFTSISMYPKLWEYSGIFYTDLITRLLNLAEERYLRDKGLLKLAR